MKSTALTTLLNCSKRALIICSCWMRELRVLGSRCLRGCRVRQCRNSRRRRKSRSSRRPGLIEDQSISPSSNLYCLRQVLTVAFQLGDGLVDLLPAQFSEVDFVLDSVVEGGDGCGRCTFAFSDGDSGAAFANGVVVVGDVFSGYYEMDLRAYEAVPDWQSTNLSSLTPLSKRSAIINIQLISNFHITPHTLSWFFKMHLFEERGLTIELL